MPMMRNPKMAGVMNNTDSPQSEMSYVDMHDLHPDNVEAAKLNGFIDGAITGGTLSLLPATAIAYAMADVKPIAEGFTSTSRQFNAKGIGFGAAIVAVGAVVMGVIKSYTNKKYAETHNEWSNRVLNRMETHEEAQMHAPRAHANNVLAERSAVADEVAGPKR